MLKTTLRGESLSGLWDTGMENYNAGVVSGNQARKIIGIVGGMGPHAGLALNQSILKHTNAFSDQQHLSTILMSFPELIGDRSWFLEGKCAVNPAYAIANIIQRLHIAGAEVIGIACNTSHASAILDVVEYEIASIRQRLTLLNMPAEVAKYIRHEHPDVKRVGLIATNGTWKSGVYENLLVSRGFDVVKPAWDFQQEVVHRMIYDPAFGIKAHSHAITYEASRRWKQILGFFKTQQVDAVVLGCTELSLLPRTHEEDNSIPWIDSVDVFSQSLIREALRPVLTDSTIAHHASAVLLK